MAKAITRKDIMKMLEPFERTLNWKTDEYNELKARVEKLEQANQALKNENNALKSQLGSMIDKIKANSATLEEQEQYMRRDCIELKGIPARPDESTNDIVLNVANLLEVDLTEDDISISHRLPPNKSWTDSNGVLHPAAPPTIIAKLVKRDVKEKLYRARYKLKNKTTKDLEGLQSANGNKIYMAESLTQTRRKLFKSALKVKKDLKYNYISTTNGKIYMKENKDSRPIFISSKADLEKLISAEVYSSQGLARQQPHIQYSSG